MRLVIPTFARFNVLSLLLSVLSVLSVPLQAQGPAPTLFGEGVLSTPDDELNSAFMPDGRTVYFTRDIGDRFGVILFSRMTNGKWSAPQVASFSGQYSDYDPFVSPDGARLYWISNRPVDGKKREDYDIWMVERKGEGWGDPIHLGAPINTDAQEFYPTVASSGALYFSSTRPGGKGRGDIYRAAREGDGFATPESLGDSVNTGAFEGDPYVAPDESFVVLSAYGRDDSAGDGDLYVSHRKDGVWGPARRIEGAVNSAAREYCPIVSPDGKWFYFTSFRGFVDEPLSRPLAYKDLRARTAGVLNGWGNVYRVPVAVLR